MSAFWRDIRFSVRLLVASPVFTVSVWLLLGIGIGANTLIFSVVDTLLLRTIPVKQPEQLVRVIEVRPTGFVTWNHPYVLCQNVPTLTNVLCQGDLDVAFDSGSATERIRINTISPNFFSELPMYPLMGRLLTPADDDPGVLNAVVSYDFWQRRMGGPANAVGRTVRLNGRAFTVVGVLPQAAPSLLVDTQPELRVSISSGRLLSQQRRGGDDDPLSPFVQIFGKLPAGTSLERAEAEIDPYLSRIYEDAYTRAYPKAANAMSGSLSESHFRLESATHGVSALREQFARGLPLLMASVALLLLMACSNVAGLLLSRLELRAQEISIRLALGAGRWRIARQLLTESLLLAIPGGGLGIAATFALRPLLLAALPRLRDRGAVIQPLALHLDINWRVLVFVTMVTLLTAILCGLAPVLRNASARGNRTATARSWTRQVLMTAQVAICVLLLAGAGVLVETFRQMEQMDIGFDRNHIVTFTVDPSLKAYTPERAQMLSHQLFDTARTLPGVEAAAMANRGLMRGTGIKATLGAAGKPIRREDFLNTSFNGVTPGYFRTMGMRILAGRDYTWFEDPKKTPQDVIVNEAFVHRLFPGLSPAEAIGKRFGAKGPDGLALGNDQIVAVVSDAKYRSLREPIPATFYPSATTFNSDFILHLRTQGDPATLIAPVRAILRSLDPELPFIEAAPLREDVEASLWQERLLAWFSSILGGFAALLAGLGLYGALDFAVRSRTREVGIRVALGAGPSRVVQLLSRQTLLIVAAGSAVGLYCYFLSSHWIRQAVFNVVPFEPWALAAALVFVLAVALLSIAAPINRAVRIEPSSALRHE